MIVEIKRGTARGTVSAPPSKSMAHRSLICGAFTEKSVISGIEFSEDIKATIDCLRALGATAEVDGDTVTVGGFCPERAQNTELYCRESGSTLRFFIPLCLLSGGKKRLFGSQRLLERPQSVYEDICREQGLIFIREKDHITVGGTLRAGQYSVQGDISSQFITGLIFALSRLDGDSTLAVTGKCESLSYINLTLKALADFGVTVDRTDGGYYIRGGQQYRSRKLTVEGDYSNAAFFDALSVLGGEVSVEGLDEGSLQGDRVYKTLFSALGSGETVDLTDCPDLAPVLFALAAAKGKTVFAGTRRLKIKESDRAEAMKQELAKFGVRVDNDENSVTVWGGELTAPKETLCGHNDHRIVMALSVLCTLTGGKISGAEAVAKSLPDFFSRLKALKIETEVYPD